MSIHIQHFFDEQTATFTYVVHDSSTKKAAIIDSVRNYDQFSGKSATTSADQVIAYVNDAGLCVEWILETHIHADHLTAARYLQGKLGGKIGIGSRISEVLSMWVARFNTGDTTPLDASQFDVTFDDGEVFYLGSVPVTVIHTPGHTPACASYVIEDAVFVGDTLFMPDVGTARTDFPGGSAEMLYDSIQKIFQLSHETRVYTCHDYPPNQSRPVTFVSTVGEQRQQNVLINDSISKEEYVVLRNKRDEGKAVPKLLLPALQVNMRCGEFGEKESNGMTYIKIPVDAL
jgi:glyoxylase-like metal-dependent hydrolase (beta-lactamase superfamily II)